MMKKWKNYLALGTSLLALGIAAPQGVMAETFTPQSMIEDVHPVKQLTDKEISKKIKNFGYDKTLSRRECKEIRSILSNLQKTPTGREILTNLPETLTFSKTTVPVIGLGGAYDIQKNQIILENTFFDREDAAKHAILYHEMRHGYQDTQKLVQTSYDETLSNSIVLSKLSEIDAKLSTVQTMNALVEQGLVTFNPEEDGNDVPSEMRFYNDIKVQYQHDNPTLSDTALERKVRTDFVKSYWLNDTRNMPNKSFGAFDVSCWNALYNESLFKAHFKNVSVDTENPALTNYIVTEYAQQMGVDLPASFFVENNSFVIEKLNENTAKLITYDNSSLSRQVIKDTQGNETVIVPLVNGSFKRYTFHNGQAVQKDDSAVDTMNKSDETHQLTPATKQVSSLQSMLREASVKGAAETPDIMAQQTLLNKQQRG